MAKSTTANIIDTVGDWFAKLPNLPGNIREVLVKITPWVALIFGVLGVIFGVLGLGLLTFLAPLMVVGGAINTAGGGLIASVLLLVSSVLLLLAFPGTNKRRAKGWEFLFWSEVVALVASVLSVSLGGVVGNLIGFYIIFQIRSYYK